MRFPIRINIPRKTDVLIYDRVGSEFILKALGKSFRWGILDVRRTIINLHPVVLFRLLPIVIQKVFSTQPIWRALTLRCAFELAEIRTIKPKVVITFIDNSRRFSQLSRICSSATFIGVQNGLRGIEVADMAHYLCLTNFFCFGQDTVKRYKAEGCNVNRFIVGGSLKDGLHRQQVETPLEKIYDFCWVSQYRPARFEKTMLGLRQNSLQLLSYIQQFCTTYGKTLAIACSCKENQFPFEYRFLLSILNLTNVHLVPNDENQFSSYKVIDQSKVTLTTSSTLGFEALSRGNKVLFCNFTNDEYYDVPSGYADGIWSLRGDNIDYGKVVDTLSKIYLLDEEEWNRQVQEMAQYFVYADKSELPQTVLKSEVSKVLSHARS